jgi:YVTN family beta-propeller protein
VLKTVGALVLTLILLAVAGCAPRPAGPEARRQDVGDLLVYLQPMPPETGRLRFTLTAAEAVREDGTAIPLDLLVKEPAANGVDRQRLLASGRLPEGNYRGLTLSVGKALLLTEEGEAALLAPQEPVFIDAPFNLARQGAALLEVAFRHEGSVRQQFHFVPAFFAHRPEPPVVTRLAFVSEPEAGLLTVFDRKSLRATGLYAPGEGTAGLALDERQQRLFIALSGEDAVAVLDVFSGAHLGRIQLQPGDRPERLALTPDGRLLLAVNAGSDSVSFLDPLSLVELSRVAVGDEPLSLLLDRGGRRAFVFNRHSDSISVLDLPRRQLLVTLNTDSGPYRGALSRDGSRLFVVFRGSPYLTVFDAATLAVRERVLVGIGIGAILVDSRTDLLYLGWSDAPRIEVYDPLSLQTVDFLEAPGGVVDLLIDHEENRLLLASPDARAVTAIDLVSKRELGRLEAGGELHSLALMGTRR